MSVLQISVNDQTAKMLGAIPAPELEALKRRMTIWLETELRVRQQNLLVVRDAATTKSQSVFTLTDFQEAMQMTDEDMLLTFGEAYLLAHNWHPHEA
jgi:hypothetical protein